MAVTSKPKPKPSLNDAAVEKLIVKGGTVPNDHITDGEKSVSVLIRLPASMLSNVDALVKNRKPIRITRQTWLLEAIHEKILREQKKTHN